MFVISICCLREVQDMNKEFMSCRMSACKFQFRKYWTDLVEIWYCESTLKVLREI
jgi:hypothetical protein